MEIDFKSLVNVNIDGEEVKVTPIDESKEARAMWGTARQLINNMVVGCSAGFTRTLEFNGVGYKAAVKGSTLTLNLGYSHLIDYPLPEGNTAKLIKT